MSDGQQTGHESDAAEPSDYVQRVMLDLAHALKRRPGEPMPTADDTAGVTYYLIRLAVKNFTKDAVCREFPGDPSDLIAPISKDVFRHLANRWQQAIAAMGESSTD